MGKIYLVKAGEGWEWGIVLVEHFKEKNSCAQALLWVKAIIDRVQLSIIWAMLRSLVFFFLKAVGSYWRDV